MRPPSRERTAEVDLTGERLTVVAFKDRGAQRIVQSGIETDNEGLETYAISADDPLSARAEMRWRNGLARGGGVSARRRRPCRPRPNRLPDHH